MLDYSYCPICRIQMNKHRECVKTQNLFRKCNYHKVSFREVSFQTLIPEPRLEESELSSYPVKDRFAVITTKTINTKMPPTPNKKFVPNAKLHVSIASSFMTHHQKVPYELQIIFVCCSLYPPLSLRWLF
jgi:hypothetical protein